MLDRKTTPIWEGGEPTERAAFSSERVRLYVGDAVEVLSQLPGESIDTCLTSPPYWSARDYGHDAQLGLEEDVSDYISKLVAVFEEVYRLLKPTGTVWLNVGDKYLNGIGTVDGVPPRRGWKRNKQLALTPFRLAIALQDAGWWVRNTVVWHKPNGMPTSAKDRLASHWEPVFLLAKSERYYFDVDQVREPHKTDDAVERSRAARGGNNGKVAGRSSMRRWLNSPRHRATIDGLKEIERRPNAPDPVVLAAYLRAAANKANLSIKDLARLLDQPFERVRHYLREDRIGSRLPPHETWLALKNILDLDGTFDEAMEVEVGDNVFRNHPKGRNPGDVRQIPVAPVAADHFAVMPYRLANWALRATLPADGVCLDPFMGTGTTGKAALDLGGRFVGIDIDAGCVAHVAQRLIGEPQVS